MVENAPVGELSVDIVARLDRLEAGINKAKKIAKKGGEDIQKSVEKGTSRLDAVISVGVLEQGLRSAARAMEEFTKASDLGLTTFQAIGEAIKQIPILGAGAQAGEQIRLFFSGEREELQRILETTRQLDRTNAIRQRKIDKDRREREAAEKRLLSIRMRVLSLGQGTATQINPRFDTTLIPRSANPNEAVVRELQKISKQLSKQQGVLN